MMLTVVLAVLVLQPVVGVIPLLLVPDLVAQITIMVLVVPK